LASWRFVPHWILRGIDWHITEGQINRQVAKIAMACFTSLIIRWEGEAPAEPLS
jgi:hypothetical protein